jgi:putative metal-binding protein
MLKRTLLAAVVAALVLPATAHGSIAATLSMQGAGTVSATWSTAGTVCLNPVQSNSSFQACGTAVENVIFAPAQMVVTATPRQSGGWTFAGWTAGPGGAGLLCGNPCVLNTGGFQHITTVLHAVFVDNTAPVVNNLTHSFTTGNNQVRFNWDVDDSATFECKLDAGTAQACTNGQAYTLPEGTHTLEVTKATDLAGNTVTLSLMDTVRVIDTILLSGPSGFVRTKTASFRFRSGNASNFDCRLIKPGVPNPPFVGCGSEGPDGTLTIPYTATDLAQDGQYTFEARARDLTVVDETPLRRTWTIDTTPPNTTLTTPDLPEGVVTTLLNAEMSFAANEPATLQCSLDGAPFAACTSPRTLADLAFGSHTFTVRAIDRAGNFDPTPAVRHWTVAAKDDDGDGFNQRSDCNDADPRVHPTAREIPANGRDEDCDGKDAPRPRVTGAVGHQWSRSGTVFTATRLTLVDLARGSKVQLRCRGNGCEFKRLKAKGRPRRGNLNLLKSLSAGQRVFRAGQTLEIWITAPRKNGTVFRLKMRAGSFPRARSLCLPPGARRPKARC